MPKWNCSSSLCFNNYKTVNEKGDKIKYYRLPSDKETQRKYEHLFKTSGFNWKQGYICADHWSSGERTSSTLLPDIIVTESGFKLIQLKYERAKKAYNSAKQPTSVQKKAYTRAKSKLKAATSYFSKCHQGRISPVKKRRKIVKYATTSTKTSASIPFINNLSDSAATTCEKDDADVLPPPVDQLREKINKLENKLRSRTEVINILQEKLAFFQKSCFIYEYDQLKEDEKTFEYFTGISPKQFEILMDCIRPYICCMEYVDCKNPSERSFSFETQFVIVLIICRHGLDNRLMSYLVGKSESTISRLFASWVMFLASLFDELDMKFDSDFALKKMPEAFIETGHGLTDIVLDATEFKFQIPTNYELNTCSPIIKIVQQQKFSLAFPRMVWVWFSVTFILGLFPILISLKKQMSYNMFVKTMK